MWFPKPVVHGVYVLCYLSRQETSAVVAAKEIASRMDVPPEQASKILQALASAGLVVAQRGRQGGYALAQPLEAITVADVFSAIKESDWHDRLRARSCQVAPLEQCTAYIGLTRLHEQFWNILREETLASLLGTACLDEPNTPS